MRMRRRAGGDEFAERGWDQTVQGLVSHSKEFGLSPACNGKPSEDFTQRREMRGIR